MKQKYSHRALLALAACAFSTTQLAAHSDVLTLDRALDLALDHNRSIEQAELGASEYSDAIAAARTQLRPSFRFNSTTGMLLTKPTITFDKGAFGEYPGIGPVPGNTTSISSDRQPAAMLSAEAFLPITQRRKIGLGIQQLEVNQRIAKQQARRTRQDVIKQVRQSYYAILQSQSSLDAAEHTLALLRELNTQTAQYVKAGTALNGDLLSVKARLAQAEYDKVALQGPLATQKEQLNLLLGRQVDTDFRVSPSIALSTIPALAEARERALTSRPEAEQARLKVLYAELDRRKKKSEYIPEVGLSVSYHSAINIASTLPRNVAIAGVQASWEPFDWGRKRNELNQKEKGIREAGLALKEAEDKIRIEVGNAYRKMREAQIMLSATHAAQESTREAARLANARFRNQAALLKDVLEAQAEMADADHKAQQALVAYWTASAELELAMGEGQ